MVISDNVEFKSMLSSLPCPKKRIYLLFSQSLKKLYSYSEIDFLLFTSDIKIVKNNIVWGGVLDV